MNMFTKLRVAAVLIGGFAAAFTSPLLAASLDADTIKLPQMTAALERGKQNYDEKCATCHGRNAAGTDKGPTFLHRVYHPGHHGDSAFYRAAKSGARAHHWPFGNMPPVRDVTDKQIQSIIRYVRALQQANGLF